MDESISPKRHRAQVSVTTEDKTLYMGTPEKPNQVDVTDFTLADSKPGTPSRAQPTPIRMGIVRKSLANFARAVAPQGGAFGKAPPPSLPPGVSKSSAPALPSKFVPVKSVVVDNLPQLRPLFWTTFPPPTDRACVWDDVDVSVTGVSDLVVQAESRLLSLFPHHQRRDVRRNAENERPVVLVVNPIVMNGKKLMKVLDDRKTQNLSIAFRRFPEPETVMEAIVNVDTESLSADQVALLLAEFPSPELCTEIEAVENSHPEEEDYMYEWDRPEQYLLVLACIHNCRSVLTVWVFAVGRSSEADVRAQLTEFIAACDSLCNSTCVRVLLATIRQIGNRMNANTPRGNARGVALESILQFDDLKSAGAGSVTLFSVVVEVWKIKNEVAELVNQLSRVIKLRIPSIQDLEIDVNKQCQLSKNAEQHLKQYYQDLEDESSVQIADKLRALADPVSRQVRANADLLAKAKTSWNKCLNYFCVRNDSNLSKNSNEFFDQWKRIVKLVEKYE